MKKIFLLFLTISMISCDNGDFEIPSFTFTDSINSCGTYVLHRANTDKTEALILVLDSSVIQNTETINPRILNITPENTQYRIFDGAIGSDFFCQSVPPQSPITKKMWNGVAGTDSYISVETSKKFSDTTNELIGYNHVIYIHNMTLKNGDDSFTYENYYFGVFFIAID